MRETGKFPAWLMTMGMTASQSNFLIDLLAVMSQAAVASDKKEI